MTIYKYERSMHSCGMSHDRWLCTVCDRSSHDFMLKWQTTSGSSVCSSNQYILPLIEEWHKSFAFLKCIVNAHYPDLGIWWDQGLCWAAEKLGQKFNPKKVDFYPAEQLIKVLTTITLSNTRYGSLFINLKHH